MLVLRPLTVDDEIPLERALASFHPTDPDWEFVFDRRVGEPFADYVTRVAAWARGDVPEGRVPSTFLVATVDQEIVGRVSIRHALNEKLRGIGGHIGYGVVPEHRGKGYATEILRQSIVRARALGLDELLLTCDEENLASRRTIEKNGGMLTQRVVLSNGKPKRHYVIR